MNKEIEQRYLLAKEKYARVGVDTDLALKKLEDVAISVQCWQGDDIQGFISDASLSGGISSLFRIYRNPTFIMTRTFRGEKN